MNKQNEESLWSRSCSTWYRFPLAVVIVACSAASAVHAQNGQIPSPPRGGPPASAPSNLTASPVSPNAIAVGWQDNSTEEFGFEVHISIAGPTGPFAPAATTGPNVTTWSDGGLVPESNRCYKVRAILVTLPKLKYSGFSNNACATTLPLPYSPPSMSSYTRAVERPGSGVEVLWSDVSGNEDGFRIEMSDLGLTSWVAVGTVEPNTTSFMATFPLCYRVFAFNASGDSQSSIPACTAPAALTNLAAAVIDGGAIVLTWTDNSAIEDGYELSYGHYGCESEGNTNEWPMGIVPANSTSFLTGPATYSGCSYDYFVVAPFRTRGYGDLAYVDAP